MPMFLQHGARHRIVGGAEIGDADLLALEVLVVLDAGDSGFTATSHL